MKIDPLYFLFSVEFALILLVLAICFFFSSRKNKDLYQKTLRKLNDLKSEGNRETLERPFPGEVSFPGNLSENTLEQQRHVLDTVSMESFESGQPGAGAAETEQGSIGRLRRMVNFQKNIIVELMCYEDVFEGAKKRLSYLQNNNKELRENIRVHVEGGVEGTALEEAVAVLGKNDREMEKFISIIDSENAALSEKYRAWEREFKRIAEDLEEFPEAKAGELKYDELLREKETMVSQIEDFGGKLDEKDKLLSFLQAKYEDLEKEYMLLYRQQQKASSQP